MRLPSSRYKHMHSWRPNSTPNPSPPPPHCVNSLVTLRSLCCHTRWQRSTVIGTSAKRFKSCCAGGLSTSMMSKDLGVKDVGKNVKHTCVCNYIYPCKSRAHNIIIAKYFKQKKTSKRVDHPQKFPETQMAFVFFFKWICFQTKMMPPSI